MAQVSVLCRLSAAGIGAARCEPEAIELRPQTRSTGGGQKGELTMTKIRAMALALALMIAAAAAAAPTATAQGPCGTEYTVKQGETLSGIARQCGTTVGALAKANNIQNANWIYVGQRLAIPQKGIYPMSPGPAGGSGRATTCYPWADAKVDEAIEVYSHVGHWPNIHLAPSLSLPPQTQLKLGSRRRDMEFRYLGAYEHAPNKYWEARHLGDFTKVLAYQTPGESKVVPKDDWIISGVGIKSWGCGP